MAKKTAARREEDFNEPQTGTSHDMEEGSLRITLEGVFDGTRYTDSIVLSASDVEKMGPYVIEGLEVKLRRAYALMYSTVERKRQE